MCIYVCVYMCVYMYMHTRTSTTRTSRRGSRFYVFLFQLIQPHVLLLALFGKLPNTCLGVARLVCGTMCQGFRAYAGV